MKLFSNSIAFVKGLWRDSRIPRRDRWLFSFLVVLTISPLDFIPDWIPVFGQLDDIVMIALLFDYIFNQLDEDLTLSHWGFSFKAFARLRGFGRIIGMLAPQAIKKRIWKYEGSPYKNLHS